MDEKKIHGKVFKQIREERGIKLKDAAGDAISVRTLIRFEADETSVSLDVFEKLLVNIGIKYHDYLSEYIPLVGFDISEFLREVRNLDSSGSTTAIRSLAVKSLQKDKISMNERLYIDQIISISGDLEGPKIIKENREIVLNHLRSLDSHNSNEMLTLTFMLRTSTAEEFSDDFIRRVIEENMKPVNSDSIFSVDRSERSLILVHGAVALLSRRGFVEEAEERCIEAINLLKTHYANVTYFQYHMNAFNYILAQIQLKLNKPEGVELANKCIRYLDAQIALNNLLADNLTRDRLVKWFYERNKTGIDFEF
ncbi:MAG: XRE family transcriptional regulator [Gemella haemolysans]|uniref:helix-turn-helix domain-containing protein n=1 Tax=Gemella haemolysans TaxID=1379 RepID=UPI0029134178|nr:XRE family transcriptional regulator [Gemella haemolysans]MDU4714769.1 XRE family transcriptional regulator [Gemella haemolysans]